MGYRNLVIMLALILAMASLAVGATDVGPMADTQGPRFESNRTPNVVWEGTPIIFNVTLTDETGVANLDVEYWHMGEPHMGASMGLTSGNTTNGTWEASYTPLGTIEDLNYRFYANDTLGNLMMNGDFTVTITDPVKPTLEDATAYMSGRATTGDKFSFWANVSDNVGIQNVKVFFTMGTPPLLNDNVTMEPISVDPKGNGLYIYNVTIPTNSTDTIVYQVMAWDTSNNFRLVRAQRYVIDNDKPEFEEDNSDSAGTTGDIFHMEVKVKDNMGVDEVRTFWGYGHVTPVNKTMNATSVDPDGSGTYTLDVMLPEDFEGELFYQFLVKDVTDMWNISDAVDLTVSDNDKPMVGPDGSFPTGDDRFDFVVNVTDNIGVDKVWVEYAFEGEDANNASMTPLEIDSGGNGTYGNVAVGIPLDRQVRLQYTIGALDVNGFVTLISGEHENVDDILPTFGANGSAGEPIKGKEIYVWVEADDNFGLYDVRVEYWFGAGAVKNDTMDDEGDSYNYTIHIPREPLGDLTWRFLATDLKGNWNHTVEHSVALYNLAPEVGDIPVWEVTEEENDIFDLQPYLSDGNDAVTTLMLMTDAGNITVNGLRLTARLDMWMEDFTINVTVTDGEDSTNFTVDITVVNVNDLPVVTSEPVTTAQVSVEYEYPVVYTDEDIGQTHTFGFDVAPFGMTVAPNGRITWTPEADQEGSHNVDLTIDDGFNVVHHQFTITVTGRPTDDPPAFTNSPPTTHEAGTDYVFDFDAEDPDGDPITFRIVEGPEDATINENTGVFVWDTDADKRDTTETVDFTVRVSDIRHDVDLEFSVTVSYPDNDPPEITGSIPKVSTNRDTSINLGTYMSDPDDDKLTLKWNATTTSKIFTVHMNGNHMVIDIKEGKTGKGKATVTLEDPWGESDTSEVTVEVTAAEDDSGGLGGIPTLYIVGAIVAIIVVVSLVYIFKGGPKK